MRLLTQADDVVTASGRWSEVGSKVSQRYCDCAVLKLAIRLSETLSGSSRKVAVGWWRFRTVGGISLETDSEARLASYSV